mgnify:CR=1 FL=1
MTLAARWPGKIEAGTVIQELISLMSLAPTFLDAAGEQPVQLTLATPRGTVVGWSNEYHTVITVSYTHLTLPTNREV